MRRSWKGLQFKDEMPTLNQNVPETHRVHTDVHCSARICTLTHGHELQHVGVHAGEWTHSSRSGLQSRDAVVELEWTTSFWGQVSVAVGVSTQILWYDEVRIIAEFPVVLCCDWLMQGVNTALKDCFCICLINFWLMSCRKLRRPLHTARGAVAWWKLMDDHLI